VARAAADRPEVGAVAGADFRRHDPGRLVVPRLREVADRAGGRIEDALRIGEAALTAGALRVLCAVDLRLRPAGALLLGRRAAVDVRAGRVATRTAVGGGGARAPVYRLAPEDVRVPRADVLVEIDATVEREVEERDVCPGGNEVRHVVEERDQHVVGVVQGERSPGDELGDAALNQARVPDAGDTHLEEGVVDVDACRGEGARRRDPHVHDAVTGQRGRARPVGELARPIARGAAVALLAGIDDAVPARARAGERLVELLREVLSRRLRRIDHAGGQRIAAADVGAGRRARPADLGDREVRLGGSFRGIERWVALARGVERAEARRRLVDARLALRRPLQDLGHDRGPGLPDRLDALRLRLVAVEVHGALDDEGVALDGVVETRVDGAADALPVVVGEYRIAAHALRADRRGRLRLPRRVFSRGVERGDVVADAARVTRVVLRLVTLVGGLESGLREFPEVLPDRAPARPRCLRVADRVRRHRERCADRGGNERRRAPAGQLPHI